MSKKLTIEFVRGEFEKEGYILLTKEYKNAHQKLEYICLKGHVGSISWDCWKRGNKCLECGGSKRLTIEFVREQFEREGYTFLSKMYKNNHQKLECICPEGHVGTIRWNSWQQGARCKKCASISNGNKNKYTIKFISDSFKKEGYTLLTKKYVSNAQKLEYVCPKGDLTNISWGSWQQGRRCIECAGLKKLTINFIREQFEKESYVLLSSVYINSKTLLGYICSKGHKGNMTWSKWGLGRRCPKCYFESNKGNGNPNYNPNLTDEDRINRRLVPGYVEWSYAVKERDNFTCQICGDNKGGNLVSHHLVAYNNNPELRTVLNNGVCLCENCHNNFHYQYGYGNNTRKQFKNFMNMER